MLKVPNISPCPQDGAPYTTHTTGLNPPHHAFHTPLLLTSLDGGHREWSQHKAESVLNKHDGEEEEQKAQRGGQTEHTAESHG